MEERAYADVKEQTGEGASWGRELPVRGEVVKIIAGELAGEEAMVEAVERDPKVERTFVRLRVYGFPWPVDEPAYAVVRVTAEAKRFARSHRWGTR